MSRAKEAESRHHANTAVLPDVPRLAIAAIAYTLLYGLLFKLGLYVTGYGIYSLWFPAAGLRYAVLLALGPRSWIWLLPLEILVAFGFGMHEYWTFEHPLLLVFGLASPTLIYALAVYFIRRVLSFEPSLDPCINVPIGFAGALLAAGATAIAGAASLLPAGRLDPGLFWNVAASALTGDLVGIMTITPAALAVLQTYRGGGRFTIDWRLAGEALAVFTITALLYFLFSGPNLFPAWFVTILPVLWLAVRFGWSGAVVAVACVNVASATAAGFLPSANLRMQLQTFMLVQSIAGLPLGGLTTARQLALDRLHRQREAMFHLERLSLLGKLAAELSHEIAQPLSAIAAYAKAGSSGGDGAEARHAFGQISEEAERLSDIVRRTRALSQNKPPEFAEIDLKEIFEELRPLVQIETKDTGASMTCHLPDSRPLIYADKIQIQQVLLNLMRNAITAVMQAPPGKRKISITVADPVESTVVITVSDTGPGLDRRLDAEQIFRPFVSATGEGTGLGLAISRNIVEAHGGRIWAEAAGPDAGTSICVSLPCLAKKAMEDR